MQAAASHPGSCPYNGREYCEDPAAEGSSPKVHFFPVDLVGENSPLDLQWDSLEGDSRSLIAGALVVGAEEELGEAN